MLVKRPFESLETDVSRKGIVQLYEDHRSVGVSTSAVEKKKPEKFRLERESNP